MKSKTSKCYLALVMSFCVLLATCPLAGMAQERDGEQQPRTQKVAVKESGTRDAVPARGGRNRRARNQPRAEEAQPKAPPAAAPVSLVNKAVPDYLTREATVTVDPKQPTVIRLGLAQNATSIVEFPASDFIYYTHEGNPQLVAIFDSPTKETDHFITLYPGTAFVAPPADLPAGVQVPTATITLQMQSGLVIILIVVPTDNVMNNAHRCVINYNREEVVAVRHAAGLAVNLDGKDRPAGKPNTNSKRVGRPSGEGEGGTDEVRPAVAVVSDVDSTKADGKRPKKGSKTADPVPSANKALSAAVKSSAKTFTKWSASEHGMSVALAPAVDLDERSRLVVVAVRNDTTEPVRLVPGNPEIYIQWFDEKGTPLNITEIKRLHVETTSVGGRIPGGQVVYYAIVYETPIIGALQKVRVSVAQISASDQPLSADLGADGKE